jgi:AraC-like DNA-binding protein
MVVKNSFEKLGHQPIEIALGEVTTADKLSDNEYHALKTELESLGFELIDDTKSRLIEKIKNSIVQLIHHQEYAKTNYSQHIESQLHKDYSYLSTLFSEVEGITIEKYIINQKIEKIKELLVYDELTLSQIADLMGYSNVAYLSTQFKKVTGLTPSHFKQVKENKRKPLDKV